MAKISIKDLGNSIDLDRAAMTAITGGARVRGSLGFFVPVVQRAHRLVDYPPGVAGTVPPATTPKSR